METSNIDKKAKHIEENTKNQKKTEPLLLWIVLIGFVYGSAIQDGTWKTFGLLYLEFLDIYDEGPQRIGLIATIMSIVVTCASPFVGVIIDCFGSWKAMLIGSILCTSSQILCSFSTSIYLLYFAYGFLLAFGITFTYLSNSTAVILSFPYHRTLALGIAFAGGSLGSLIYPFIIQGVIQSYSVKGYLLLSAGVWLNYSLVAMMLFATRHAIVKGKSESPKNPSQPCKPNLQVKSTKRTKAQNCFDEKMEKTETAKGSRISFTHQQTYFVRFKGLISPFLNLKVLSIITWCTTYYFFLYGYLMYLPPFSKEFGLSEPQRSVLLSIYGGTGLISKIVIGVMGVSSKVNVYILSSINMLIVGIMTILLPSILPLGPVYSILIGHMLIFGLLAGGLQGLLGTFIVDAVGVTYAGTMYGASGIFFGVATALPPVIYGAAKESTGTYIMVAYMSGAVAILACVCVQIGQIKKYFKRCCWYKKAKK